VLETERLTLDLHQPDDVVPMAAIWADPETILHLGGRPADAEACWMRLLRYRGLWPVLGYGYWAIREKQTGAYVGEIGFADFHRKTEPSIAGIPEAGWVLATAFRKRGYAREALQAALRWLARHVAAPRSVCLIAPANLASIRLAETAGYAGCGTVRLQGQHTMLLQRRQVAGERLTGPGRRPPWSRA
jgi:RimJ/RimL family protein N-acetyltransferase